MMLPGFANVTSRHFRCAGVGGSAAACAWAGLVSAGRGSWSLVRHPLPALLGHWCSALQNRVCDLGRKLDSQMWHAWIWRIYACHPGSIRHELWVLGDGQLVCSANGCNDVRNVKCHSAWLSFTTSLADLCDRVVDKSVRKVAVQRLVEHEIQWLERLRESSRESDDIDTFVHECSPCRGLDVDGGIVHEEDASRSPTGKGFHEHLPKPPAEEVRSEVAARLGGHINACCLGGYQLLSRHFPLPLQDKCWAHVSVCGVSTDEELECEHGTDDNRRVGPPLHEDNLGLQQRVAHGLVKVVDAFWLYRAPRRAELLLDFLEPLVEVGSSGGVDTVVVDRSGRRQGPVHTTRGDRQP